MYTGRSIVFACLAFLICACESNRTSPAAAPDQNPSTTHFSLLSVEACGVDFMNAIVENDSINVIDYDYMYNGAGVAVGDFNGDGLQDLYFTANQTGDRLYLNRGNLRFEDVSSKWNVDQFPGWSSGAVVVDINQDGWLDVYVCRTGPYQRPEMLTNRLLINQQGQGFSEEAAKYGLDYTGHSTMAAFFDMDKDGDLDCYLMTHSRNFRNRLNLRELQDLLDKGLLESDHLYRNEGGVFIDVSEEAGISDFAFGLGLAIEDVNGDTWPDIYVSNDFDEGDLLYINQHDGSFKNQLTSIVKHTSNYGMGCDIADFNNDLLPDLLTLDMAFETHERAKRNMASMDLDRFNARLQLGWHYQYMQNTLQLNNGDGTFSDIAQLSGAHKTDWSWTGLFCDLDHDGWQDIFITNGYKRDTKDNDLVSRVSELQAERANVSVEEVLGLIPSTKVMNYGFRNKQDLTFERASNSWGITEHVNSNGAVYADLDNDGDLDLVLNNIDERAYIYRNEAIDLGASFIGFDLEDPNAVGARIILYAEGQTFMRYYQPVRGYLASVDRRIHFGLPAGSTIDSMIICWPDDACEVFKELTPHQYMTISRGDGSPSDTSPLASSTTKLFKNVTRESGIIFRHQENPYDDFEKEVLLPHRMSEYGPAIAKGDLNGDGLEDIFLGGCSRQPAALFFQQPDGAFKRSEQPTFTRHALAEDVAAVCFDADGDGDLDLYVVSGDASVSPEAGVLRDRLYLNEGGEVLSDATNRIPDLRFAGGSVCAADLDGDGDQDLFIGGHHVPGMYPYSPSSIVLINEDRLFVDRTSEWLPQADLGMIAASVFADINADGLPDLITAGEWCAPQLHLNNGNSFNDAISLGSNKEGWWFELMVEDVDGDGYLDVIAGNLGENNKFHPNAEKPLLCYANDFDRNGTTDIVLAKWQGEALLPVRGRECSSEQMPFILRKFKTYKDFAEAELQDIYAEEALANALQLEAKDFSSYVFYGRGDGSFDAQVLPIAAQMAPNRSVIVMDVDADGDKDLLLAGNFFGVEVETLRYDAGNGVVLLNKGNREWKALLTPESGLSLPHDIRRSVLVRTNDGNIKVVSSSNQGFTAVHQLLD